MLLGADSFGRDLLTRNLYAARVSLSVGLVGVVLSFLLGLVLGGISGYYGGTIDNIIQRVIDFLISLPTIPVWMGLAAALPHDWGSIKVYFAVTLILSIVGWTGLARVVRGKLLELREADFVMAARVAGARQRRVIVAHLIPSFMSYLIVHLTLAIPRMILGETALSFLGMGIRPPAVSWGTLLQDAQNIQTVVLYPWLMFPGAVRGRRGVDVQLPRRRPARRRRSLQVGDRQRLTSCIEHVDVARPVENLFVGGCENMSAQRRSDDEVVRRIGMEVRESDGLDAEIAVDGDLDHALGQLLAAPRHDIPGESDSALGFQPWPPPRTRLPTRPPRLTATRGRSRRALGCQDPVHPTSARASRGCRAGSLDRVPRWSVVGFPLHVYRLDDVANQFDSAAIDAEQGARLGAVRDQP